MLIFVKLRVKVRVNWREFERFVSVRRKTKFYCFVLICTHMQANKDNINTYSSPHPTNTIGRSVSSPDGLISTVRSFPQGARGIGSQRLAVWGALHSSFNTMILYFCFVSVRLSFTHFLTSVFKPRVLGQTTSQIFPKYN